MTSEKGFGGRMCAVFIEQHEWSLFILSFIWNNEAYFSPPDSKTPVEPLFVQVPTDSIITVNTD